MAATTLLVTAGFFPCAIAEAASTVTTVATSKTPIAQGANATFTARVTGLGAGAPTGSVNISSSVDGALGSAALDAFGSGSIATGSFHSCALTAAGAVSCWGSNWAGQLGNNSTTDSSVPVNVSGLTSVVALAAGNEHTCALTSAGTVSCWGNNYSGQLGNGTSIGTNNPNSTPIAVAGLSGVVALAAGRYHTCALTSAGTVSCWGFNEHGQLGNATGAGTSSPYPTPVAVAGLSAVVALAAGELHTCALTSSGMVSCWGQNFNGQLGNATGTSTGNAYPTPAAVAGLSGVVALAAGNRHTCALTSAGAVSCWGFNYFGQLGNAGGAGAVDAHPMPTVVAGLSGGVALAAGASHTCALTSAGAASCWGYNNSGQLGNATGTDTNNAYPTPVAVAGLSGGVALAAGANHTCALTSAGTVNCWGNNYFGQLGNATSSGSNTPNPSPLDVTGVTAAINAKATLTTSLLSLGIHTITASYTGDGNHIGSNDMVSVQVTTPLAAPVATTATAVLTTGFTMNWNYVGGATNYSYDLATDSNFSSMVTSDASVGDTDHFSISSLNPATTYYYRIRATNDSGASDNSNTIGVTTPSSAPANDNFGNAALLSGAAGSTTGSNVGATKEGGEPNHAGFIGGASVWWQWTAPSAGTLTVSTAGSNFNTLLGVYNGNIVYQLSTVASNDDENNPSIRTSRVSFVVTAGTTYRIAVDGYNGGSGAESGAISLSWNLAPIDGYLTVSGSNNIAVMGPPGGPFYPSSFSYVLKTDAGTANWSISGVPDWLTPSATSGLATTSGTTVTFSVNTNATIQAVGAYGPATIAFTNTTNGQGSTSRTAGLTVSPIACEAMARGPDFNGDSKGEILWRSDYGVGGIWFMNGTTLSSGPGLPAVPTAWRIAAVTDFNADGKSDILWRNTSSGEIAVWFMSGVTVIGTAIIGRVSTDWKIIGAGDLNSDGKADLLWRQDSGALGVWLLNNGAVQSTAGLGSVATSWRVVGLGDFNGDGKTDLLWRDANGIAAVWLMNGTTVQATASLGAVPTDWKIVGVGDFDGDTKADILWRQDAGVYAMWFMNGGTIASSAGVGTIPANWHIAGTNDYNGDGKTDLLWRQDSGTIGIWLMNGAAATATGGVSGVAYDWHVINGEHDRPPVLIQPGPC